MADELSTLAADCKSFIENKLEREIDSSEVEFFDLEDTVLFKDAELYNSFIESLKDHELVIEIEEKYVFFQYDVPDDLGKTWNFNISEPQMHEFLGTYGPTYGLKR